MAGKLLLDTNAAIALFGRQPAFIDLMRRSGADAGSMLVSAVSIGELYFGAFKSTRLLYNLQLVDQFVRTASVVACDAATARECGQVKQQLRLQGRPIPENDLWTAAISASTTWS